MSAKILISSLANSGKTTLLQSLEDVLVVAHDGKKYPFPQPHIQLDQLPPVDELIGLINEKVGVYKEKFGKLPRTIAFDSVSTIFESIAANASANFKGFDVWKNVNEEVYKLKGYIEDTLLANNINVVIISHATWDVDTASYQLVAQGNFAKKGGFLSTVDQAVFIEVKNGKRIVHHRSAKFASRTTLKELPDNQPVEEYNLQKHIEMLEAIRDNVASFRL